MTELPFDIIDKIFTVNPNTIISTYLAFARKHSSNSTGESTGESTRKQSMRKKQKLDNVMENTSKNTETINYLLDCNTYMKYYKQSSWFKYFIPISISSTSRGNRHQARMISNSLNEKIGLIANYFNQLDTNYKNANHSADNATEQDEIKVDKLDKLDKPETLDTLDTLKLITRLETLLETGGFDSQKYEKQLDAITQYYTGIHDIPVFVSLVLMLYNCGYFVSSSFDGGMGTCIHPFLDLILEGDSAKITEILQTYKQYSARYKFIPLFSIYLEMGYSFVIGWETGFNSLIGMMENGSDYHEVIYNARRAMRYFTAEEIFLKISRKELEKELMKMLGIKDITILLEYAKRLNISEMF
jgi:hypothetical protein